MRLAVTGIPLKKSSKVVDPFYGMSDFQKSILAVLGKEPGLTAYQIKERVKYHKRTEIDLPIQGLIKRTLVKWELNRPGSPFRYSLTKEGFRFLEESEEGHAGKSDSL